MTLSKGWGRRAPALVCGLRALINGLMDLLASDKIQAFKQVDSLEERMFVSVSSVFGISVKSPKGD